MKMIKGVLMKLLELVFLFFDIIFWNKSNTVFSCRAGNDYADNSRYLYEYFLEQGDQNVFFYTKNRSVLKEIPRNGIYAYSLKGVLTLLRSKTLIFTHGIGDFTPYRPSKIRGRKYINLFHAIAVKKVGSDLPAQIRQFSKWDNFIVSSKFEKEFMSDLYHLDKNKVIIMGQPRNDALFLKGYQPTNDFKKILYAPTFRDSYELELFSFDDLNLEELDNILVEKNITLIIRLHINDEKKYVAESKYQGLRNIVFEGSKVVPSINDKLHEFDMVISDYSSIVLDYLIVDRPIGYIIYDYEKYKEERGFSFDFLENLAGPVISTQEKLIEFLTQENDVFKSKRKEMKDLFHQHQDGESSKRIYKYIKNI